MNDLWALHATNRYASNLINCHHCWFVKVLAVQVQMCSTMYHEALTKLIDVLQMDFFKRGFGIQILDQELDVGYVHDHCRTILRILL
jgi:hypothetical protein